MVHWQGWKMNPPVSQRDMRSRGHVRTLGIHHQGRFPGLLQRWFLNTNCEVVWACQLVVGMSDRWYCCDAASQEMGIPCACRQLVPLAGAVALPRIAPVVGRHWTAPWQDPRLKQSQVVHLNTGKSPTLGFPFEQGWKFYCC